jgi:poly(3-hydroxybutyrate) depolymerase
MVNRKIVLLAAGLLFLTAGLSRAQERDTRLTLTHDGLERSVYVHAPPSVEQSAPLVIALHPLGSSGRAMAAISGFNAWPTRKASSSPI